MQLTRQLAQNLQLPGENGNGTVISGPDGFNAGNTLGDVIGKTVPYLFVFSGIALLLMLIFGGFSLLTSGGDPKQLESGKQKITYSIIGFIIVFLAFWAVQLIAWIFNIQEFKCIFGFGNCPVVT